MRLTVNGEELKTGAGTLQELIQEMSITAERVAVEVNLKVIRKKDYRSFVLNEGDTVEIVNFVGGG